MTQFIDLSIPITNNVVSDPPVMRPQVSYMTHDNTWEQIAMFFPGLTRDDLPDGEGWAVESLTLSTHNGTHMDAPWHFHSTTDSGATPAPSIDEAPLDLFFRPGVKLDFSNEPHGHVVSASEVEAELARIGYALQPLDIVLVQSGAIYGTDHFTDQGVGLGAEATLWLTERGVKVVGTDAWSWDAPFSHTAKRWAETRDPSIIWEGHKAGRIRPYYQIEKLTNLAALPPHGFTVCCFPVKIERASAGWIRAVAILEELPVMATALAATLRAALSAVADPARAPAMQAYMKSAMPYMGVPSTQIRAVCRTVFGKLQYESGAHWQADILEIRRNAEFREEYYAAIELAAVRQARKFQRIDALPMYRELIISGGWWDTTDAIAPNRLFDILVAERAPMTKELLVWASDENMWIRRSAILCQMKAKDQMDLDLLYACIEPLT